MQFGVCSSLEHAAIIRSAGWDYIEAGVGEVLQGALPDEKWTGAALSKQSALPIYCVYLLVPPSMKIVGPEADLGALTTHLARVITRAATLGIAVLGFGSGGARNIPDEFDRQQAERQLLDFARVAGRLAEEAGVVVAMEPLHRGECNFVNTIEEVAAIVRSVNSIGFRALLDTYHLWRENEPLDHVQAALPLVAHVHVADLENRAPPGESGSSDYLPVFQLLKRAGYDRTMSVESRPFDVETGTRSLQFLKRQWKES